MADRPRPSAEKRLIYRITNCYILRRSSTAVLEFASRIVQNTLPETCSRSNESPVCCVGKQGHFTNEV